MRIEVLDRMTRMVEKRMMPVADGSLGYRIVDSMLGTPMGGTVSERYTVVQNRHLVEPFLNTFGVDAFEIARIKRSGESVFMVRTGREFDIGGGDIVKERIAITNSYNKSRAFSFIFGAFRLICSNGLFAGEAVVNYKKIHVGEIPVSDIVQTVLNTYKKNDFSTWKRMREVSMTLVQQLEFVTSFKAFEEQPDPTNPTHVTPSQRMNESIVMQAYHRLANYGVSLDNQRNAWGLLNAINRAITMTVSRSNFGRVVAANRTAERAIAAEYLN